MSPWMKVSFCWSLHGYAWLSLDIAPKDYPCITRGFASQNGPPLVERMATTTVSMNLKIIPENHGRNRFCHYFQRSQEVVLPRESSRICYASIWLYSLGKGRSTFPTFKNLNVHHGRTAIFWTWPSNSFSVLPGLLAHDFNTEFFIASTSKRLVNCARRLVDIRVCFQLKTIYRRSGHW